MRRSIALLPVLAVLALAAASPAAANSPEFHTVTFTTDPYVLAECDGYDVMEQLDVSMRIQVFFDRNGEVLREVTHATDSGIDWRSDTNEQLATYSDAGGTFTAAVNNVFTWTGIHNLWTLTNGEVIRGVGRVVVAEVAPGDFQRIFEAGSIPDDVDPCSW
jgi:hypothetical protein